MDAGPEDEMRNQELHAGDFTVQNEPTQLLTTAPNSISGQKAVTDWRLLCS